MKRPSEMTAKELAALPTGPLAHTFEPFTAEDYAKGAVGKGRSKTVDLRAVGGRPVVQAGERLVRPTQHWCKHCDTSFYVKLHEDETGDFFLECPTCHWLHYRRFEHGAAIHCELAARTGPVVTVHGRR